MTWTSGDWIHWCIYIQYIYIYIAWPQCDIWISIVDAVGLVKATILTYTSNSQKFTIFVRVDVISPLVYILVGCQIDSRCYLHLWCSSSVAYTHRIKGSGSDDIFLVAWDWYIHQGRLDLGLSNFSMKRFEFRLKFHWSFFSRDQFPTFQYWFR